MEDCEELTKKNVISRIVTDDTRQLADLSIWKDLKDAIQGTEADYTLININKAVLLVFSGEYSLQKHRLVLSRFGSLKEEDGKLLRYEV